jgi:hypothetical protein
MAIALAVSAAACAASAPPPSSPTPVAAAASPLSTTNVRTPTSGPDADATADATTGLSPASTPPLPGADAPSVEAGDASPSIAPTGPTGGGGAACNDQAPQDFLVRSNFLKGGREGLQRAIQYRTDTYGYFKGFGHPSADAQPPSSYVVSTTFMGLRVKMHRKVVPALQCAEDEIKRACADHPYTPQALAGIRFKNTYRGGEVTNHIFGIAIDIDPARNTCCGCVKPWSDVPVCTRPAKTEYDRMALPECWVHAFERYGFYWLGHDVLRDTMHFEFLGDPDRIVKGR